MPATTQGPTPSATTCATVPTIYLRLSFVDPEGEFRHLPTGVPVKVLYGVETNAAGTDTAVHHVGDEGKVQFPAWVNSSCRAVTLAFEWTNEVACILCEPQPAPGAGSPTPSTRYVTVPTTVTDPPMMAMAAAASSPPASPPQENERFFTLPKTWQMKQVKTEKSPGSVWQVAQADQRGAWSPVKMGK